MLPDGEPLQQKYKAYLWDFRNAGYTLLIDNEDQPDSKTRVVAVGQSAGGTPVLGPLPLLGVGAALGFSRKLRKRIKPIAAAPGSAVPLA